MPRTPALYTRWSHEMRHSGFFHAGERVGVAVSGGPDSVLLLAMMRQLARDVGLKLAAVHFNHHLRGDESEADERFVREQAQGLEIDFLPGEADVANVAREKHRNLEATARALRYQFFFSLVSQGRVDKVATAHTANDQAETVLLKLLRGAGTRGLGGIYPALEGKVVRPFLSITRAEVEEELKTRKLETRLDSTNADTHFQRNKMRKHLIPLLQKEFNPEVIGLLKELADRARDDEAYLEEQAHERARPWRVHEGLEDKVPARFVSGLPPALSRRVLRQMLLATRGHLRGITYHHIEALRRFAAESQSGRRLALPGGCEARREFDWLILAPRPQEAYHSGYSYPVQVPGEVSVPQLGLTFHFKIVGTEDRARAYNALEAASFDLEGIAGPLVLRNWHAGDRWRPSMGRKPRLLKDFFIQRKIPAGQRMTWPVLVCGESVLWAQGMKAANGIAPSASPKRVLVSVEKTDSKRS